MKILGGYDNEMSKEPGSQPQMESSQAVVSNKEV
jgi:hypothetical protein